MKRAFIFVVLAVLCSAIPCLAQSIPVPQGATVTTSMDVTKDQLMQQLSIMSSAISVGGSELPDINWDELKQACDKLERVQFSEMDIEGKFSSADIISLYEKKIPGRRVLFTVDGVTNEGFLLTSIPKDGGYFCCRIAAEKDAKHKIIGAKIQAVRLYGFPDVPRLAKFAGTMVATLGDKLPGLIQQP